MISGLREFFWRKFQNSGVTAVMVSTGPIVRNDENFDGRASREGA